MTYGEIYQKAKGVLGEENILDYRPAVFEMMPESMLDGVRMCIPNTIMIWLKNGDCIWYRAEN